MPKGFRTPPPVVAEVVRLRDAGLTHRAIAARVMIGLGSVHRLLHRPFVGKYRPPKPKPAKPKQPRRRIVETPLTGGVYPPDPNGTPRECPRCHQFRQMPVDPALPCFPCQLRILKNRG